jgi:TPR repeat protein
MIRNLNNRLFLKHLLVAIVCLPIVGCVSIDKGLDKLVDDLSNPLPSPNNPSYQANEYFSKGIQAGKEKKYTLALEYYTAATKLGHNGAANNTGSFYEDGNGVNKNNNKALEWYKKSASYKGGYGQANVGRMYYLGRGVTKNYVEAAYWLTKSANQNQFYKLSSPFKPSPVWAAYYLGVIYDEGYIGGKRDVKKAYRYLLQASRNDHAGAKARFKRLCKKDPHLCNT